MKSHPEMLVTSKVKMRNGMDVDIDFAGSISETIIFPRAPEILLSNLEAATQLIDGLGPPTVVQPENPQSSRSTPHWTGVPAAGIIQFLQNYQTHQESWKVNSRRLAEFVTRKNELGQLTEWSVALLSGSSKTSHSFANVTRKLVKRDPRKRAGRASDTTQAERGVYIVGRLLDPPDEWIDLSATECAKALANTQDSWRMDAGRSRRKTPPDKPSGLEVRALRGRLYPERGLLLIYPLDPSPPGLEFDGPVIGFGISFPSSDERVSVRYTVNNVYWNQEYAGDA